MALPQIKVDAVGAAGPLREQFAQEEAHGVERLRPVDIMRGGIVERLDAVIADDLARMATYIGREAGVSGRADNTGLDLVSDLITRFRVAKLRPPDFCGAEFRIRDIFGRLRRGYSNSRVWRNFGAVQVG